MKSFCSLFAVFGLLLSLQVDSRSKASGFLKEASEGIHGVKVYKNVFTSSSANSDRSLANLSAGPHISKQPVGNKIVLTCPTDRCKACVIRFKNFMCIASNKGGGDRRRGVRHNSSGLDSFGRSCTYADQKGYGTKKGAAKNLPPGYRDSSVNVRTSSKGYRSGKYGDYPPLSIKGILQIHSRTHSVLRANSLGLGADYVIPKNAKFSDIEGKSSWGCPLIGHECMDLMNKVANGLSFKTEEISVPAGGKFPYDKY